MLVKHRIFLIHYHWMSKTMSTEIITNPNKIYRQSIVWHSKWIPSLSIGNLIMHLFHVLVHRHSIHRNEKYKTILSFSFICLFFSFVWSIIVGVVERIFANVVSNMEYVYLVYIVIISHLFAKHVYVK